MKTPADGGNSFAPSMQAIIAWLVPFVVLVLVLGWETDWGGQVAAGPVPNSHPAPSPVEVALLPDFAVAGGLDARKETVERTLFNPTRRPAPPAPADGGSKSRMQRGQFVLTGTAVSGGTTIAFLRETNGGKSRTARVGDVVNGMTVADVRPDRIRLVAGEESEDVVLKVATGPKTTVQPAVSAAAPAAAVPVPGPTAATPNPGQPAAGAPQAPAGASAATPPEAQTLLERRRAARAAAAAQGGVPPVVQPPMPNRNP